MPTYTFNYGVADTVRDDMAQVTMQLKNELENMAREVENTLADWEDSAKDAYWSAKAQWTAAADRMPFSLNAAEVALEQISGGYLHVEHTGVNTWGGYTVK